jgi:hypothetical protein
VGDERTIMREIGACVGHIVRAVREDVVAPPREDVVVVRREHVEEQVVETPAGKMVARRTVVEELVRPSTP